MVSRKGCSFLNTVLDDGLAMQISQDGLLLGVLPPCNAGWLRLIIFLLGTVVSLLVSPTFDSSRWLCWLGPFKRKGRMAVLDVVLRPFSSSTSIFLHCSPKLSSCARCVGPMMLQLC